MSTLLSRSILSHILPVFVTVLLIGGVLGYALETHLFVTVDGQTPAAPLSPPPDAPAAPQNIELLLREVELLRLWIIGIIVIALLVGVNLASLSAYYLERPLARLTSAVEQLTRGERLPMLDPQEPREINALVTAFNTLNGQLHAVENSREHLLTNVVHELGRPLGAMKVAVRALREGAVEDPTFRDELFIGIEEEIQRLNRLLDNLAQLGGTVLNTFEIRPRSVALADWLPTLLRLWQPTATSKGITWQSEIPAQLPIVMIDPDRMGQVLGNLISNAIRYTPSGGSVTVRAGEDGSTFWVEVRDTGIGIPDAEQAHVFDPFFRSSAHTRFPQGMGLGLPIARDIVHAHKGTLALASRVGEGSVFTVSVPFQPLQADETDEL